MLKFLIILLESQFGSLFFGFAYHDKELVGAQTWGLDPLLKQCNNASW